MLCYVMLCVVLCYVMSYVMLCHVMLCCRGYTSYFQAIYREYSPLTLPDKNDISGSPIWHSGRFLPCQLSFFAGGAVSGVGGFLLSENPTWGN